MLIAVEVTSNERSGHGATFEYGLCAKRTSSVVEEYGDRIVTRVSDGNVQVSVAVKVRECRSYNLASGLMSRRWGKDAIADIQEDCQIRPLKYVVHALSRASANDVWPTIRVQVADRDSGHLRDAEFPIDTFNIWSLKLVSEYGAPSSIHVVKALR